MKIIFFGNYQNSVEVLKVLLRKSDLDICAVVTRPKYKTKEGRINRTPVDRYMIKLGQGNRVIRKNKCNDLETISYLNSLDVDLLICVSYSSMIPLDILKIPRFGSYNFHPSLLPRWRGPDPIRRAIYHGDKNIGVSVHSMNEDFDAGDIVLQKNINLELDDTLEKALNKVYHTSRYLASVLINSLYLNCLKFVPQNKKNVTYAHPLKEMEKLINPYKDPKLFYNLFRALYPFEYPIINTCDGQIVVKSCKFEKKIISDCLINIKTDNGFLCIC